MGILDPLKAFVRIAATILVLTAAGHAQGAGGDAGDGSDDGSHDAGSDTGVGGQDAGSADDDSDSDAEGLSNDGPGVSSVDPDTEGEGVSAGSIGNSFLFPQESRGQAPNGSGSHGLDKYVRGPDGALDAVQADRALPLDSIVTAARHLTPGQIIDARLKAVRGALQYELKVLEATGQVRRYYFDARTGQLAKVR